MWKFKGGELRWEKLWQKFPLEPRALRSTHFLLLHTAVLKNTKPSSLWVGFISEWLFFPLGFPSKLGDIRKPSINQSFCSPLLFSLSPHAELLSCAAASRCPNTAVSGATEPLSPPR